MGCKRSCNLLILYCAIVSFTCAPTFLTEFLTCHGTRQIYEAGWTERKWEYPPVAGKNGYIGPAAAWAQSSQTVEFDPKVHNPNDTFTFPVTNLRRNAAGDLFGHDSFEYWWFGKLGNGSQIENGNYTIRFAVLKPFGDPSRSDNWDVYQPPQIQVLGKY